MFDLDEFIKECEDAQTENDSRRAIREVLDRAIADAVAGRQRARARSRRTEPPPPVGHADDPQRGVGARHDVAAARSPHVGQIGIYAGQEDNAFFRRTGTTLTASGGKELHETDVLSLGDDAIHSVTNPRRSHTGAIHIYGGDFVAKPRSQWDPETMTEEPYDYNRILKQFEAANQSL